MSLHRFFAEGAVASSGVLPLTPADVHHVRDVLRLKPGQEIVVVAGGAALRVRITAVGDAVEGEVVAAVARPKAPRVTLVQGLAKGDKIDTVVRQATEIGVTRIVLFDAERSVVRLDADKAAARTVRWQRVAAEAAKQSQRVDVPVVHEPVALDALAALLEGSTILICQEDDASVPGLVRAIEALAPGPDADVAIVIGPEGGLAPSEVSRLEALGGARVSLGPAILRTETAAVVAVALALHARGGMGGARE